MKYVDKEGNVVENLVTSNVMEKRRGGESKRFRPRNLLFLDNLRLIALPLFPEDERSSPDTFEVINFYKVSELFTKESRRVYTFLESLATNVKPGDGAVIELRFGTYTKEDGIKRKRNN